MPSTVLRDKRALLETRYRAMIDHALSHGDPARAANAAAVYERKITELQARWGR
jgi:hypothetical protein